MDGMTMDGVTEQLVVEKKDGVGYILLDNQAKRNAMTFEMWRDLPKVLDDFMADDAVRVVVLSGQGGKAFCAGADISQFEKNRSTEEGVKIYNTATEEATTRLREFLKPTIAKIEGPCVGGGVGIATCCDIRIAEEAAIFAIPAAKLGLGYRVDGLKPFVDLVGPSFAREVFYTARTFSAQEAKDMGLINRVVPRPMLDPYIADYTKRIAENAPLTIKAVKVIVHESVKGDSVRDLDLCARVVKDCFDSADYTEGRTAFMEKRKPQFKGK
ncbi:MAG: enoyl-CoA hydratase [Rhodospirillaceae bacterium]